jgi:hypothetical protein
MMKQTIHIDSAKGGNGDLWMRLIGYYVVRALYPDIKIVINIPKFLVKLAEFTFGDRLEIINAAPTKADIHYTTLGIKDLIKPILKGSKFIAPYQKAVIHDKKNIGLKDKINTIIFNVLNYCGVVHVPPKKWIENYQGFLEIIGLPPFRNCNYGIFCDQLRKDYPLIFEKLNKKELPTSPELEFPVDIENSIIFFPTGTSRQFVPVGWAKKYMRDAYYAFFYKDEEATLFLEENLKVVFFYKEPGDILKLAQKSKYALSTDSFPSHLLQFGNKNTTIMLTEVLKSRIVAPTFQGVVVDSIASCHPCLHIAKTNQLCAAGYLECLNWKNEIYTRNIIESFKQFSL